jgi:hypothetical protein
MSSAIQTCKREKARLWSLWTERVMKDHVGLTGALQIEQDSQSVFDAIHSMWGHRPNSAQQPFLGD